MPELPEVETIARKLRPVLAGRRIVVTDILWTGIVDRPDLQTFQERLNGSQITDVGRRGKFLVFELDGDGTLLVHLRMSGKFTVRPPEAGPGDHKHARARIRLDNGVWLIYVDQRKFGRFYLVDDPEEIVEDLGPEPLAPGFRAEDLCRRLSGRRGEIKRLLLNQHFVAGLGNIYANEALWRAGIHPQRVAGSLSEAECHALYRAIVAVLEQSIQHGGTSLDDRQYVYPDGGLGEHQEHLKVYDQAGNTCVRCGCVVERFVQGQRSTYYCPVCQPERVSMPEQEPQSSADLHKEIGAMKTTTLNVSGMSCGMCVKHVTHALKELNGVVNVEVELEPGTAKVTYDEDVTGMDEFRTAVAEAGYQVVN
ncbi:MAG: bifunctional DNA-formamidopyrimidine glycosylase/DNA-(apurinic or apyrimidinic site) lyase [Anaerolineae bacterium]